MSRSTDWSGVVGGEVAGWAAEAVVERDRGGQREELAGQAGAQGVQLARAVVFEAEHVLGCPEDALHALADRGQVRSLAGFVLAAGSDDQDVQRGRIGLELAAGVALVADHGQRAGALDTREHVQRDLALGCLGAGQRERAGGAVGREQAVQPEAPEVARVTGAVAVVGGQGERAAARGLDRAPALDRGAVDDEQVVLKARAVACELDDQRLDRVAQALATFDEPGTLDQAREQMPETFGDGRPELLVGADAQQLLCNAERYDLRVGQDPPGVLRPAKQEIVGGAVNRDKQQVEVGVHRGPSGSSVRDSTADFDLRAYVTFSPTGSSPAVEQLI